METVERKDSFIKKGILGFFIGLAVIIPGVSGSTIAIIFKLYHKILNAIANLGKEFKKSILFLLPIILGGVLGLLFGFLSIQKLLAFMPFVIICLFAGLMLGATPSLYDEIRGQKFQGKQWGYLVLGILVPLMMTLIAIFFTHSNPNLEQRLTTDIFSFILYIFIGFLVAVTQFVPGGSATSLLMALGYFMPLMNALHLSYIKENPMVILIYASLFFGFLLGSIIMSKSLNALILKYKNIMYFLFIGLSLGSVLCLFFNVDMLQIYKGWGNQPSSLFLEMIFGGALFIFGGWSSYQFVVYTRKRRIKNG